MRGVVFVVAMLFGSSALCQVGVAQQATGEFFKSCQAKLRGSNPDVRIEREAVENCTIDAAVSANVLPAPIVDTCREEMKSLQAGQAGMVRRCAELRHIGAKMDDREWRLATDQYCRARANLPGDRQLAHPAECMVKVLLEQRQVSTAKRQACTKAPTGNAAHDAEERWRCLSAPGTP